VLVARYGEEDGRLEDGGRSCSVWWKEVVKIRNGVGGDGVVRRLGDDTDMSFWRDRWCGDVPFCIRFSRLFD